jgi:uncharacterized protein (DUF2132 family)
MRGGLSLETAMADRIIPNELQLMHQIIYSLPVPSYFNSVTLLTSSLHDGIVRLLYNWPQRDHSASIEVVYFHKKKEIELSLRFFGQNEYARWNVMADYLKMSSFVEDLPLKTVADVQARGIVVSWRSAGAVMTAEENRTFFKNCFKKCSDIGFNSLNFYKNPYFFQNLERALDFWLQQDHACFLLGLDIATIPVGFAQLFINRWETDEAYRSNTLWLNEQLESYDVVEKKENRDMQKAKLFYDKVKALKERVERESSDIENITKHNNDNIFY